MFEYIRIVLEKENEETKTLYFSDDIAFNFDIINNTINIFDYSKEPKKIITINKNDYIDIGIYTY